jgi:cytochrome c oxidase accessory protein FixG
MLPEGGLAQADVPSETVQSLRDLKAEQPIYVNRIKVYPKRVTGTFRRLKWMLLTLCLGLYYVVPWLRWDRGPGAPDQAILLDIQGPRAYFFAAEIWPQEIYFLTGLLVCAALALFLVSSLFGRLWCGYACPQTVWTDLFMWIERLIEGDRNARIRLDAQPWSIGKTARKVVKHAAWLAIAAATGGAWIMYYVDAPTATRAIFNGTASTELYFFIGLFTATTYVLAGWAREQVCTYMCPWPRFQAAMFDENTLTVTYQGWRGEQRGKHKTGDSWEGRGDCVDCRQCVAVCPTGIDIRDGQQLECIGCGLCIDACNPVMEKVGRPRNLITFATLASQTARAAGSAAPYRLVRPRVVLYSALLCAVVAILLTAFMLRTTVEISVLPDRAPLFVTLSDGAIRNGYTFKILNKAREPRRYGLSTSGIDTTALSVVGLGNSATASSEIFLEARPDNVATYKIYLTAPRAALSGEATQFTFRLRDAATGSVVEQASAFHGPTRQEHR